MSPKREPTAEGRRRYPRGNGYYMTTIDENGDEHGKPCICQPSCHMRCAGECGCEACSLQFTVFCDEAGLYSFEKPWTPDDEEKALKLYRSPMPPEIIQLSESGLSLNRYPNSR